MNRFTQLANEIKSQVKPIDIVAVKTKLDNSDNFYLIDVREESEWQKGRITKAIHLSKGRIESRIEKDVPDVKADIVLYCGGGSRAALAGYNLQKMGYTQVKYMDGGFRGWCAKGYKICE